jgi:very-short-patch-repair endonuclease
LNEVITTINNPHVTREDIDDLLLSHIETVNLHKQTQKLKSKTTASHSLLKTHLDDLKLKGVKVEQEDKLRTLIDDSKDVDVKLKDGVVHLVETKDKVIEKTVQDAKTKELIKQMGLEIYRIYSRYPKIREEASP